MSTEQHEALKAADWIEELLPDIGGKEAAEKIRTQYALIAQMADCMKLLRNHTSVNSHQIALIDESLVPATQYLKGSKT